MKPAAKKFVQEMIENDTYEYYPLGQHVVAAPGVCGGRPTFKYTRLEVAVVLDLLAAGWTVEQVVREYVHSNLTPEAVEEAVHLAREAFVTVEYVLLHGQARVGECKRRRV
jgi:uncharacterized protein (DUF433 family)